MSRSLALARGVAVGCVASTLLFAVAVLAGLADAGSGVVFLIGALAGAGVGLSTRSAPSVEAMGAFLVGVVGLIAGLATGFGWLEFSVIGGAVVSGMWLITGEGHPSDPWRWFRWGGVLVPILFLILLPLIVDGGTLGHDESAYALKARQWLEGTPGSGWSPHRGTGMSVYGYVVLAMGGDEAGLRFLGLAGVIALAIGTWALGHRMAGPRVGAIAAVAVIAGPAVLRRSTEYLSDVPAAALLMFCMVIVWRELKDRDLPSYHLLWALPLAWGAFYLRYQSALSLALIAVVAVWLWWPKIRRRPAPVLWLVAIGVLGLVPHVAHSIDLTGRPWGILLNTGGAAVRDFVGQGLRDYADQFFWALAGWVGPVVLVAAVAGLIVAWGNREARQTYTFLLIPAVLQVIAIGLISRGEPRFIFFPIALVVVAGTIALDAWSSARSSGSLARAVGWGLVVLLAGSLAISATEARRWVGSRTANNEPVEMAALEVANQIGGESCGVLTSYDPQVTFYSGCFTQTILPVADSEEKVSRLPGEFRFMVLIENGKRQPVGAELAELIALTDESTFMEGARRSGTVYRFAD
jgi:hypothetical protein